MVNPGLNRISHKRQDSKANSVERLPRREMASPSDYRSNMAVASTSNRVLDKSLSVQSRSGMGVSASNATTPNYTFFTNNKQQRDKATPVVKTNPSA